MHFNIDSQATNGNIIQMKAFRRESNAPNTWKIPVNCKTAHPPAPLPRANPGAFDFFEKIWSYSSLDDQIPHPLELQRGSNRAFVQMYISCNKQLATLWINNRPVVVALRHTFTYEKKNHPTNNLCQQRRAPKGKEALNM